MSWSSHGLLFHTPQTPFFRLVEFEGSFTPRYPACLKHYLPKFSSTTDDILNSQTVLYPILILHVLFTLGEFPL